MNHLREQWRGLQAEGGPVTEFLQSWDQLNEMQRRMEPDKPDPRAGWKYRDLYDLVNKEGRAFTPSAKLPKGVKRGGMGDCFRNALLLANEDARFKYVEGYGVGGGFLPVHHAWVTQDGRTAIEVTWASGMDYHGIVFDTDWAIREVTRAGYFGVLGDLTINIKWMQKGFPPGAIER